MQVGGGAEFQVDVRGIDGCRQFEQARTRAGKYVAADFFRQTGIDAHAAMVGHRQGQAACDGTRGDPAPQKIGFKGYRRMFTSHHLPQKGLFG